ncbi:MAG: 6,7-dimethyl-8-ribityllumazine synthase [Dysgonamonadaceae bacterium]|jgi:6,7-dimethyl-8-ribityllumazine synthase|nr:6,7-dimethyl-8-ribityllumazine synthase [Dysgonamonadaceae bacterium]
MATQCHNLSDYNPSTLPDAREMKFGIVVSEWNSEITFRLRDGAIATFKENGVKPENIHVVYVPGSFELIYAVKKLSLYLRPDAVVGFGCVIRGETPHFDCVCGGVTQGFAKLNAEGDIPYIFGLLTTDNMQQAVDRAGGRYGNKGDECAVAAIKAAGLGLQLK